MPENPTLESLLRDRKDHIVDRFVAEVKRKDLSPPGLSHSLLVDHIPRFIDEILEELSSGEEMRVSRDAVDTSPTARDHGQQRWTLGYDLEALIREYGILRHCLLEAAKEANVSVSIAEFDVLAKCLNIGIAEAASAYAAFRDAQVTARNEQLKFLADAGQLLATSLDHPLTLSRLTQLIVPRLADFCVIDLEGTPLEDLPVAHVNADLVSDVRALHVRLSSREKDGGDRALLTTKAVIVEDVEEATASPPIGVPSYLPLLREAGISAWMVVPLGVQGIAFGSISFGRTEPGSRYVAADLVLAEDLARRASVAIDNARLYELSQQARSRVELITRAKDEFVAMVSHELRTPLNAILGWMHLLRNSSVPADKRARALDVVERNARAQQRLVADLLDISRIISGKVRLDAAAIDLADLVEMTVEGLRPAVEAKRLKLTVKISAKDAVIHGDGDRLQQVVWNLLTNAVKFTPKGGAVHVALSRVESNLELVVEDDGIGISTEFLPHVFETFRQSDTSSRRVHGGLGVGLSIAKHLVELHGGSIVARSDGLDRGARFAVSLPVSAVASTAPWTEKISAAVPVVEGFTGNLSGVRVLIVDDDDDARDLLRALLETYDITVATAPNAAAARSALEQFSPELVISDIGMPGEDGYDLIRSIRIREAGARNVPAIALTAYARTEDRAKALTEGFNAYLSKPVEPAELLCRVAELLGRPLTGLSQSD